MRTRIRVRWDSITTVVVAASFAFALGMAAQYHVDHLGDSPAPVSSSQ